MPDHDQTLGYCVPVTRKATCLTAECPTASIVNTRFTTPQNPDLYVMYVWLEYI
jgi:hypothetical protein